MFASCPGRFNYLYLVGEVEQVSHKSLMCVLVSEVELESCGTATNRATPSILWVTTFLIFFLHSSKFQIQRAITHSWFATVVDGNELGPV